MDRQDNECLADTCSQRAGVIACLVVEGCGPSILFRQFERRVGLGKDVYSGDERVGEKGIAHGGIHLEEVIVPFVEVGK